MFGHSKAVKKLQPVATVVSHVRWIDLLEADDWEISDFIRDANITSIDFKTQDIFTPKQIEKMLDALKQPSVINAIQIKIVYEFAIVRISRDQAGRTKDLFLSADIGSDYAEKIKAIALLQKKADPKPLERKEAIEFKEPVEKKNEFKNFKSMTDAIKNLNFHQLDKNEIFNFLIVWLNEQMTQVKTMSDSFFISKTVKTNLLEVHASLSRLYSLVCTDLATLNDVDKNYVKAGICVRQLLAGIPSKPDCPKELATQINLLVDKLRSRFSEDYAQTVWRLIDSIQKKSAAFEM